MKRSIWLLASMIIGLTAATPEQVERYLLISGAEDQLLSFEQSIDQMGQMMAKQTGNDLPLMQDSQLLSIRFRTYLQQHLSESEMDAIIANYGHDVMRKLVSAEVLMGEPQTQEEYRAFFTRLQSEPLPKNRTEAVHAIVKGMYDEEVLVGFFDSLYMPMIRQLAARSGWKLDAGQLKKMRDGFVKRMREQNEQAMLFMTRDFSDEELSELETIAQSSATDHEAKALFGAIEYAMEEAMRSIARRMMHRLKRAPTRPAPTPEANRSVTPPSASTAKPSRGAAQTTPARSAD